MINIITKNCFTTLPWKNGKGQTTELAINNGASLAHFDWRISIAEVTENGLFSDFSGYQRHLILIDGQAIKLYHDRQTVDHLRQLFDFSSFSGNSTTHAELPYGPIRDFNIITKKDKYQISIITGIAHSDFQIEENGLSFVYSCASDVTLEHRGSIEQILKKGDLLQIENESGLTVNGTMLILVHLNETGF